MDISDASQLIPVNEAGKYIPNRPSRASVWRWISKGVRGHRLASFVIGSRRYVTPESIAEWLAAINESCSDVPPIDGGSTWQVGTGQIDAGNH